MLENKALKTVPVYFSGKRYDVPEAFTVLQAFEYSGHRYTRGCGCRGGVCGACAALFIHPGSTKLEVGLACQTRVVAGMVVVQLPFFPTRKPPYELDGLVPQINSIGKVYPHIYKCVACNTCTKMCPQGIKVMDCMSAALRGDVQRVAEESRDCVMCGLCASRCPAEIGQYHIMLLCRRLYGKYIQKPYRYLPTRLRQIEDGSFDEEIERLMASEIEDLKPLYQKQQEDKKVI